MRKGVRETWRSTDRVFHLVWQTSPALTITLAVMTLLLSVVPAGQVWLAGQLIDEVVAGIAGGGGDEYIRPIAILAVLQLLLFVGGSLFQTLSNISQQLLQERLAIHVQLSIMDHANSLDLADFENAAYDQLQQAERESANRPVQMVSSVFGLARSAITFATMIGLLIGLSPWIAVAALVSPIPAFISGSRYGWWGFQRCAGSPHSQVDVVPDNGNDHRHLQQGNQAVRDRRSLHQSLPQNFRRLLQRNPPLLIRRYLAGFGWGALTIVASSATFLYVALQALRGVITLGQLTVFTQAAQQVQISFQGLLGGVQGIYEHGLYLSTLHDLLDREPAIEATEHPVPVREPFLQGIEFRDVSFGIPTRRSTH